MLKVYKTGKGGQTESLFSHTIGRDHYNQAERDHER